MPPFSSPGTPEPNRTSPNRDRSGYFSEQTIAALATAVGGAIAVIRISGPEAFSALGSLTGKKLDKFEPRRLTRALLRSSDGSSIDDALFACFPNPDSYTGEDVVELHVHGGAFTSLRLLEALSFLGVRQALPGEFSFRAVRNGKMSLDQAEAVADLISASNEDAVALALEKLSGAQHRLLSRLAEDLRKLCSLGELGIDFADQDVAELGLPSLKTRLASIETVLRGLQESFARGSRLQEGVGVAFIGLPNAGKSSFFNALLGEDRALVSEIPGTTRDVLREKITLRGSKASVTLRLEDTAGLRSSTDHVEKLGIARSSEAARRADLVLFLVDPSAPIADALTEWKKLEGVAALAAKTLGVLTKCDLLPGSGGAPSFEALRALEQTGISAWLRTSALTGNGIAAAASTIADRGAGAVSRARGEILLTRLDQLNAVEAALSHLARARSASEIDFFASDIRHALHALGPLIGDTVTDDILGRIFSDFCIGK